MNEKILVPVLGESITEATVAKWLKNVGDAVEADEAVVELETDKVNLEVPSPISGTVGDIKFKDGDELLFVQETMSDNKIMLFASNGKFYTLETNSLPSGRGYGDPLNLLIDFLCH